MSISLRDAIKYAKKGASSIQPGPPSLPGSAESLQQTIPALRLERLSGRSNSFNWEQRTYKEQSTRSCSSFNEDAKNRLCIANVSKRITGGIFPAKVLYAWRWNFQSIDWDLDVHKLVRLVVRSMIWQRNDMVKKDGSQLDFFEE